jgi:hypothetical protein
MKIYYKVRSLGRLVLRVYCIALSVLLAGVLGIIAVLGWYVSNLEQRIDADWCVTDIIYLTLAAVIGASAGAAHRLLSCLN